MPFAIQRETLLPTSQITIWKILRDSLCPSWSPAMLTQVVRTKQLAICARCDLLQTQFVDPHLIQYCSVRLQTRRYVLLMLWINKQINNETKVCLFFNASVHQSLRLRCECVCVCVSVRAGRVMSSGTCCVNKDRTVTAYWMEMNARYEDDWQC